MTAPAPTDDLVAMVAAWLAAPWEESKALQRPLADGSLSVVATGALKQDSVLSLGTV